MKNLLTYMDELSLPHRKTQQEKILDLVEEAYFTCCDQLDRKYGKGISSKINITKPLEDCLGIALGNVRDTSEAREGMAQALNFGVVIRQPIENLLACLPETPTGVALKVCFERAEMARLAQLEGELVRPFIDISTALHANTAAYRPMAAGPQR